MAKFDAYQAVTDRIIEALEQGTVPWRKPWQGVGVPTNLVSKKPYRGVNLLLLGLMPYASPYWLTFKQARQKGGSIKKGEKSTIIVFWTFIEQENKKTQKTKKIPILRYYRVFNIEQCEGIEEPQVDKPLDFQNIEACERIAERMPNKPVIKHGGGRAAYDPSLDKVMMPNRETFDGEEAYYSVLFHELAHSTGHKTRLNRKEIAEASGWLRSDDYSREELVAEMTAAFLMGEAGVEYIGKTIENTAAYIQSWMKRLSNDRKLIVQAAGQAQKAADYILDRQTNQSEESDESEDNAPLQASRLVNV